MRREIAELVDAARGLGVRLSPTPANAKAIRLDGDRDTFPDRLRRVAQALEAVDRAGGVANAADAGPDASVDAARLRLALDGVFRWMRMMGLDVTEPHAVVAAAMGVESAATKGAYKPKPAFAGNVSLADRPGGKPKPMLKLVPEPGEKLSIENLRRRELRAQMIEASLGAASAPQSSPMRRKG